MNDKLKRLAERREHLVAQSAFQRVTLAQNLEPWLMPLSLADQGLAALRFIKNHPAWIVGGGVLLSTLRSDSLGKCLRSGWIAWLFIRGLRAKWSGD
ncbi:MAG: YqjK-like family protein [Betaproteobacteria bacterium]|nr:YqjK-like family protein [Betaproteobacteria bacterium]